MELLKFSTTDGRGFLTAKDTKHTNWFCRKELKERRDKTPGKSLCSLSSLAAQLNFPFSSSRFGFLLSGFLLFVSVLLWTTPSFRGAAPRLKSPVENVERSTFTKNLKH